MGKPQNAEKKNGNQAKVAKAKSIQDGQIKKSKQPKAKQTPAGKIALINGKSNGNAVQQKKPVQAPPAKKSPQQQQGQGKKNQNQKQKQQKVPAKKQPVKEEEEDSDDDEDDIDEGIPAIKEDVSMNGSEEDSDDDDDDESGDEPDIFGQSLADDSDDDDEDFGDDDEEEEDKEKNGKKGIKPFKGIKVEKEEDDDDEDDETDAMDTTGTSSLNSSVAESDEEDDDDDDEDDESEEDSKTGLSALMGDSLVDDENDEDFEEDDEDDDEEDDDISEESEATELNQSAPSPAKSEEGKKVRLTDEEKAELDKRTIFIGNVPMDTDEKKIKATFKSFGPIENIRIRGVVPESPNMPLKVAVIKKKHHAKATAKCAFVAYKAEESAVKALALNGTQLDGNYLRVDRATEDRKVDSKKSIFIGNVPFDAEDNEFWELFKDCGKIDWVRTVRDRHTGLCRGVAYVNFKNEDSVALALNLNGQLIKKRPIRVERYKPTEKKPKVEVGKKRARSADSAGSPAKKSKQSVEQATKNSQNAERRKDMKNKRSQGQKQRTQSADNTPEASPKPKKVFQGQKADNKKKPNKGGNKFEKKKQHMAAKLTSKPKKPVKN